MLPGNNSYRLLASLYRPSVPPYLISWFKYTPSSEIATLSVPVLILQRTTEGALCFLPAL